MHAGSTYRVYVGAGLGEPDHFSGPRIQETYTVFIVIDIPMVTARTNDNPILVDQNAILAVNSPNISLPYDTGALAGESSIHRSYTAQLAARILISMYRLSIATDGTCRQYRSPARYSPLPQRTYAILNRLAGIVAALFGVPGPFMGYGFGTANRSHSQHVKIAILKARLVRAVVYPLSGRK